MGGLANVIRVIKSLADKRTAALCAGYSVKAVPNHTAFRLARYFATTPDFWINLQARHDLDAADRKLRRRIEREVRPRRLTKERA
jgi:plasmid maintenance system antidote protein VapI